MCFIALGIGVFCFVYCIGYWFFLFCLQISFHVYLLLFFSFTFYLLSCPMHMTFHVYIQYSVASPYPQYQCCALGPTLTHSTIAMHGRVQCVCWFVAVISLGLNSLQAHTFYHPRHSASPSYPSSTLQHTASIMILIYRVQICTTGRVPEQLFFHSKKLFGLV